MSASVSDKPNVCVYEKLLKAIWAEALQEPNLIHAVRRPERPTGVRVQRGANVHFLLNLFLTHFLFALIQNSFITRKNNN